MLKGKKIGILLEGDYYEPEIWYYKFRFAEEGMDVHFLTRLWGCKSLTFKGHEYHIPMDCSESFENMTDDELKSYAAIIVPAGMVADRLRYTDDVNKLAPAVEFIKRAFSQKKVLKGIICHAMWLVAPAPELVRGRKAVVHNNLLGDAKNMGIIYVNEDVVVDGDLVTGRSGGHCNVFAKKIIELIDKA